MKENELKKPGKGLIIIFNFHLLIFVLLVILIFLIYIRNPKMNHSKGKSN